MSISLDAAMLNMNNTITNNYNGNKVTNTLNKVSSNSTDDELMEVCKDFQSYFMEEVIKEIKQNMTFEEEKEDNEEEDDDLLPVRRKQGSALDMPQEHAAPRRRRRPESSLQLIKNEAK